jgi:O-antigen/teichoic acid export membrane protein
VSTGLSELAESSSNAAPGAPGPESVGNRLASHALWSLFGTLGARAFSVLSSIVCARILGQDAFGALGNIQNNVRAFAPLSGRGLGTTATRFVARYRRSDPDRASRVLSLTLFVGFAIILATAVVFFGLADFLAADVVNRPDLAPEIRLSVFLFIAMSAFQLLTEALAGFEGFRWIARANQLEGILMLVAISLLAWFFGLIGAIGGMIIATGGAAIFACYVLFAEARSSGIRPLARFGWSEGSVLASYSLPNLLILFISMPAHWYLGVLLFVQPDGAAQTALFTVAGQWRNLLLYLPAAIIQASMPILSQMKAEDSKHGFERLICLQTQVIWLMTAGAAVGMICFSTPLLAIYGPKYAGAHAVIVFGAILAGMQSTSVFFTTAIASQAKMWFLWWSAAFASATLAISSLILVPKFGAVGALLGNSIFYLSQSLVIVWKLGSWQILRTFFLPMSVFVGGTMLAWALVELGAIWGYLAAFPISILVMVACWFSASRPMREDMWQLFEKRFGSLFQRLTFLRSER